jgi:anti-sigma-K factor RsiG
MPKRQYEALMSQDPTVRRRTITNAAASPHLADLSIVQLRGYRQRLTEEEEKVSYWRRLTHARIDLLEAGSRTDGTLSIEDLVRVLGDTGAGRTRKVLLSVKAADALPDLPELDDMWATEVDPHDAAAVSDAVRRLRDAEGQLTDYRRALHERIDEATAELIVRYRSDPAQALLALPSG